MRLSLRPVWLAIIAVALIGAAWKILPTHGHGDVPVKAPSADAPVPPGMETAYLAGGCFWSMQAMFQELKGVDRVLPGYAGGTDPNPTYEQVCSGDTGYAETVQIVFDPKVISYRDLLHIFFTVRDPTTPNRQGNDVGSNYRSMIFYRTPDQQQAAEEVIKQTTDSHLWSDLIVTQVVPFSKFYQAEDYHYNYYRLHPNQGYCRFVVAPEVSEFERKFADKLKA